MWILAQFIFFIRPEFPGFLGRIAITYIKEPWYIVYMFLAFSYGFHIVTGFNIFMGTAFSLIPVVIGAANVLPFGMVELNLRRKAFKTESSVRTSQKMNLIYREVQVVLLLVNSVYGCLLIPMQTLITKFLMFITIVQSSYSDRIENSMKIIMGFWMVSVPWIWICVLEIAGNIYMHGERVLMSWKYYEWRNKQQRKFMSKFRKSCKPIMIHHGRAYIIRRKTVLKFIRGLVKGIFRTLLTLGKH
jgi:hypothetical protein